jgi:single-strand DNA-binding protein
VARTAPSDFEPVNSISIVGRLAAAPVERELPSSDIVVTCRVVVPRGDGKVDTLDCAAWSPSMRKRVLAWSEGDVVSIEGALHRRFWRAAAGPASRYEIEVLGAKRVSKVA